MIAANYRRHADALIAQMELDLSGTIGASEEQRAAWWAWLMNTGTPQAIPATTTPAWWVAAKRAAMKIAQAVKTALLSLF